METGIRRHMMKCKKCEAELQEAYTDFVASYLGYAERYVNCWECKTVNVVRYEEVKVIGTYPMDRHNTDVLIQKEEQDNDKNKNKT
jgi:hypothetical protein